MTGAKAKKKLLTETELELMHILWRLGEGSVHDVLAALPEDRPLAYTSVSTMLRILEQKEMVSARKQGRGHRYSPTMSREDYEATSVNHLLDNLFEGAPLALVARLLESRDLTNDELDELRGLLDERSARDE